MPFDDKTRNRLARFVTDARELIRAEFTEQLQRVYGISATGDITTLADLRDLDEKQRALAEILRERVDYLKASSPAEENSSAAAVDRLTREQAFTVLNRLAAIRMAEKRGFIVESVGHGYQSKGFQVYCQVAGSGLGDAYHRYRQYLFCLFDELAFDLGALFDRRAPTSLLFPRESALVRLFELINAPDIDALWADDETIGWIYQYFNSKEERQQMREQSAAPRDSRELAIRNQFFTPRYVVEFLVDNTLGRIWYEMRTSDTGLKEKCRYLVRRPLEIFLGDPANENQWLYGEPEPESEIPEPIAAAYRGDLSRIEEFLAPFEPWVAVAITPDQFSKITGQKYDPANGSALLSHIWDAIEGKPESPILSDVLSIWTGLSDFVRTSSGSPYDREPFEKLWNAFKNAIRNQASRELSQEEVLKSPVYIPFREKKDPRDLKILDPAVGSGHFLLYAFDLLQVIYEEAWSDGQSPVFTGTNRTLRDEYPDIETLRRQLPELVLRHNLHGVDVDLRACQIAALALWLRAQRAWQDQGLRFGERPKIRRSNIVCAEPMPGEPEMLDEFVSQLQPKVLGQLVRRVFQAMNLAGEAGPLLKIEEEIATAVAEAKKQWLSTPKPEQFRLFGDSRSVQQELNFDFTGITDQTFWEEAEERIYTALRAYAEQFQDGGGFQRRLFAEDASRGFAFIDLCRTRYDTILMNPPFGAAPASVYRRLEKIYPSSYTELYACFVERAVMLCSRGAIGAITSRGFLTMMRLTEWRQQIAIPRMSFLVDLGPGVMDDAMVRAAAYVLTDRAPGPILALDATSHDDPASLTVGDTWSDPARIVARQLYVRPRSHFADLPLSRLIYKAQPDVGKLFKESESFGSTAGSVRAGLQTFDNDRFVRARWEVPEPTIGPSRTWEYFSKGGDYAKYYTDVHLVINRRSDGAELAEFNRLQNGQTAQSRRSSRFYYRPGLTFTSRSNKGLSVRAMPADCVFSHNAPAIFAFPGVSLTYLLGWANSRLIRTLVEIQAATDYYTPGSLDSLPWRRPSVEESELVSIACADLVKRYMQMSRLDETSLIFTGFLSDHSLGELYSRATSSHLENVAQIRELQRNISNLIDRVNDIDSEPIAQDLLPQDPDDDVPLTVGSLGEFVGNSVASLFGTALGRWDVRFATLEKSAQELPDPFAALPVCSPGMLQNEDGTPLTLGDGHHHQALGKSSYSIEIPWGGILVDDHGHPFDIEVRLRKVLEIIWKDRAEAIEQEACEILGYKSLRDYFRKPTGFFDDHLKRYSKSRRQAPIYWPLSTRSGSYTLWMYYPRLSSQTLHACLADFLDPKLKNISDQVRNLRQSNSSQTRLGELLEFEDELKEMRTEIERLIKLPYEPDLNDGVLITASPLWKLFRLPKWQKDLRACWQELERGDYDWAHLAYSIWPDRVKEKCKSDRPIAIAHGLEQFCSMDAPKSRTKRSSQKEATLIEEDTL